MEWGFKPLPRLELPHYDLLSLLTTANSCFLSISLYFSFSLSLSVNDFYALLKHVGALREDLNATNPLLFFWWISAFFSASLWWRQGSFKPGSAHGRLPSQCCPLSSVLACWRKRGWGSSLTDPVIARKAYMSTHAGFLIGLHVGDMKCKDRDFIFSRRWSLYSKSQGRIFR